jgi:hypothetical protein
MSIVSEGQAISSSNADGETVNMMPLFHVGGIVRNLLAVRIGFTICYVP